MAKCLIGEYVLKIKNDYNKQNNKNNWQKR